MADIKDAIKQVKLFANLKFNRILTQTVDKKVDKLASDLKTIGDKLPTNITINVPEFPKIPEIKIPEVKVTIPDIKLPPILVPEVKIPSINYTPPRIVIPPIKFPEITLPSLAPLVDKVTTLIESVKVFRWPTEASSPISVRLSDGEKFIETLTTVVSQGRGGVGGGSGEIIPTQVNTGRKVVTTSGIKVQLSGSSCVSVTIKALSANTGFIYVGGTNLTTSNGLELAAGESVSLSIDHTEKLYIDASVNGDGVSYLYNIR